MGYPWKFIDHIGIRAILFFVFVESYKIHELSYKENHITLAMADVYVHNNPRDPTEERLARLEEKFVDISCNMALLVADLANNIRSFGEFGGCNSEIGSEGKSRDNENP
jgi:hypothetical protein